MAKTAVGQSEYTPVKEAQFRAFLDMHLKIAKAVISKQRWANPFYHYFDLFSGPGYTESGEGSPIIFVKKANELHVTYNAFFFEIDRSEAKKLRANINGSRNATIMEGDNADTLPDVIAGLPPRIIGLIYSDPNGTQGYELLAEASKCPALTYTDILINCNAASIKRNLLNNPSRLSEKLGDINKKHWLIREPIAQWQWSFLFGTQWCEFPEWAKRGFYKLDSSRGQDILRRLNHTAPELEAFDQMPLPYSSYQEYLRHPEFLEVRKVSMARAAGRCSRCGAPATEVHHLKYPPWGTFDEPDNLLPLCHDCHCKTHGKEN